MRVFAAILPGTGRGTMCNMVEGALRLAPGPLHHRFAAVPLPVPGRIK